MKWYDGNIVEAVNLSKSKNAIFLVFAEGPNELSTKLNQLINNNKILSILESEQFVAIKISSDSEAYMQFAQIYKIVPLPSIFFIGKNGTPLEIVTGIIETVEELEAKINSALERAGLQSVNNLTEDNTANATGSSASASANFIQSESTSEVKMSNKSEENCENGACTRKTETVDNKVASQQTTPSKEKLDRAKELLEQKKKLKEIEEKAIEQERELNRRKQGQDAQTLKKWQEDQEMKQIKEERKREKQEEQAVRKRILEQIEQDRLERIERFGPVQQPQEPKVSTPGSSTGAIPKVTVENKQFARIQFKLPNGKTEMHTFNSTDTFHIIRDYVKTQLLNNTNKEFILATTFPRRELTAENNNDTLIELNLSPTSVLLVLILNNKSASANKSLLVNNNDNQNTMGSFSNIMWSIFQPILFIFTYFKNFIIPEQPVTPPRSTSTNSQQTGAQKRLNENILSDNDTAKRRNLKFKNEQNSQNQQTNKDHKAGAYRRVGNSNVHRLNENRSDSDEDNNTWNGNSTQQM